MGQLVFVKVVGFTDVERHALNTVFRLSGQGSTRYAPWEDQAPEPPRMLVVDGLHPQARAEVQAARAAGMPFTWVGTQPPRGAWHLFMRPINWPHVVMALDEFFAAGPEMEIDLDGDVLDTRPTVILGPGGAPSRALIVGADPAGRLYLRAKLALALWTQADEAADLQAALELARCARYELVVMDLAAGEKPWALAAALRGLQDGLRGVIAIHPAPSLVDRLRARLTGLRLMRKPPHPGQLHAALGELRFPSGAA